MQDIKKEIIEEFDKKFNLPITEPITGSTIKIYIKNFIEYSIDEAISARNKEIEEKVKILSTDITNENGDEYIKRSSVLSIIKLTK